MYTKTQERLKKSECLKAVYSESKLPKFRPERTKICEARANEIFNDFAISREPFNEIDSNFFILKVWTRK